MLVIYRVNFGEASRHLEGARGLLGRAAQKPRPGRRSQRSADGPASIDDAQRMAGKRDQIANSPAGAAAKIVADVLDAEGTR